MSGKRVVIVGSGLGGLSCAVILAKNGYEVTVLEQSSQVGGCLQCFYRRGVKFETGMHFIGSAAPGQTLNKLLEYLEIDTVELSPLDASGYDVVSLGGKRYSFAMGREAFINTLCADFPGQRDNLERYYSLIETVSNASSLHSLRYAESDVMVSAEYQLRSVNDVISHVISDETLQRVLVGNLPLYAGRQDITPFSTHAFITDFYNKSAYRIVGGSDNIAKGLVKSLIRYGGTVTTNAKVTQIVCDEHRATAVTTRRETIPCDVVISDAHPEITLTLLDTPLIRRAYRHRVVNIPQTIGGFTIYIKFKENTMPYMNYNYYGYRGDTPWGCEDYDAMSWPKGYLYMHLCHEAHARFAQTAVILSYMHFADVAPWRDTAVGHRGDDYNAFKVERAERLLDLVSIDFPNLRSSIDSYFTSTPLTYRDYTGAVNGGMYGIEKNIHSSSCRVSHKMRVPNVLQTGQNINSHGMLGTLVGTIVTCSELIPAREIYRQITLCDS